MIEIKNLTKIYENGVKACNDLSFIIEPGVVGLVGHNGAGKSTLLRMLSGVIYATSGEILVDGNDYLSKEAKEKIFFLPDNPFYRKKNNIKKTIEFYNSMYHMNGERLNNILKTIKLPTNRRLSTFSKGMRRQLFLAIALSIEADIYMLDEAFDGIDPIITDLMKNVIKDLANSGKTIILSSHNLTALNKIANKYIMLSKGVLTEEGDQKDISKGYVAYQIFADRLLDKNELINLGIDVVSLKNIGSISHLVVRDDFDIKEILEKLYKLSLIEKIEIDADELLTIEMLSNNQMGGDSNA